jgi:hypothetical protein
MTQPQNEWGPDQEELDVLRRFAKWTGGLVGNMTPRLNKALAAVQAELPTFGTEDQRRVDVEHKDGTSHSYRYVTLGKVIEQTSPILAKQGLSFRSMPGYGDPGDGKIGMVLRYTLAHESGEQIDGVFPLSSGDKGIQGMGSAITYARRYCLAALLNIAVEQDDDGMAAMLNADGEQGSVKAPSRSRQAPARSNRPAARAATPAAADALPGGDPAADTSDKPPRPMLNHMFGLLGKVVVVPGDAANIRDARLKWVSEVVGRDVDSSNDLTRAEAQMVIDKAEPIAEALAGLADGEPSTEEPS